MTWIDFKALRKQVRFEEVLRHYNVQFKRKGEAQAVAFCPLPGHNGERKSRSFSVNMTRGIFQCFSCGAKGNVLDFACYMQGLDPSKPGDVRRAATLLYERFVGQSQQQPTENGKGESVTPKKRSRRPKDTTADSTPQVSTEKQHALVNAPLDFELKSLDPKHPYLRSRGLTPETITCFGLGYCSRGLMAGRVVIPLHDQNANLTGYAGRLADDRKIGPDQPKYLFPGRREHKGVVHEFRKSLMLYNGHRLQQSAKAWPLKHLIVVEGFAAVWWLWQQGFRDVVALMGSSCSDEQAQLMTSFVAQDGCLWLFPDGDEAGRRCAADAFVRIGHHCAVRYVRLDEGRQPTDCDFKELVSILFEK